MSSLFYRCTFISRELVSSWYYSRNDVLHTAFWLKGTASQFGNSLTRVLKTKDSSASRGTANGGMEPGVRTEGILRAILMCRVVRVEVRKA